jgi:hypothetical protein
MKGKSIDYLLREYNEVMKNLSLENKSQLKKALESPEQFLIDSRLNVNGIDKDKLISLLKEVTNIEKLKEFSENPNFQNANNLSDFIRRKPVIADADIEKQKDLAIGAVKKDLTSKVRFCFIGTSECDDIIDSHSIQKNRELLAIAKNGNVLHFARKSVGKKIESIHLTNASAFPGFCYKHDQIFEPIDKNKNIEIGRKLFLYSIRSFAFSYYSAASIQKYYLTNINTISESILPIIQSLKMISSYTDQTIPQELNEFKIPELTKEQDNVLKAQRFEDHRISLIKAFNEEKYTELDYLTYEINHISPMVCASWMIMHSNIGNAYSTIYDETQSEKIYNGIPIIISVLPEANKTKIILARFKSDVQSEFIFNQLESKMTDKEKFEIQISKLIIENVDNFFLDPVFWDNLQEPEKEIVCKAVAIAKSEFPETRVNFDIINFFDAKYKVNQ